MNIKKQLIMVSGFFFGLFSIMPWPWSLKKLLARLIKSVRDFGTSHFSNTVISYVESTDEDFKMGKTHGVNDSIELFKETVEKLENKNPKSRELIPIINLVKNKDFQDMSDKELSHFVRDFVKKSKKLT